MLSYSEELSIRLTTIEEIHPNNVGYYNSLNIGNIRLCILKTLHGWRLNIYGNSQTFSIILLYDQTDFFKSAEKVTANNFNRFFQYYFSNMEITEMLLELDKVIIEKI